MYLGILVFVSSCLGKKANLNQLNSSVNSGLISSAKVDTLNLKYTENGLLSSILVADQMLDFSANKFVFTDFPNGVKVTFYDKQRVRTTVVADRALSFKKSGIIDLIGNVVIKSDNGQVLKTQQLYHDQKTNWFYTEHYFHYTDESGSQLEGPGVDFSKDFKVFNMQNSKGRYHFN